MTNEIAQEARKAAILNAVQHSGKANAQAVLGVLLGKHNELRSQARELIAVINDIVQEVNSTPLEELRDIVDEKWSDQIMRQQRNETRTRPPLPNAEKYAPIVTRVAPNPDFVLHLGNARAAILSHDYARMYHGKFIVRFEDTDPRLKKPQLGYYEMIRQDLLWLGCEWDEEYIQSDRLSLYYQVGTILIHSGVAYVCECEPANFREKINSGQPCPDRNLNPGQQDERWGKMLEGQYKEGKAVVRVKTDLAHPNPAVRDWPAFRIIDTLKNPHPRVGSKFHVWPLYNLASGVDDHLLGVTHVIRGKEHLTNMSRQLFMYNHLGWHYPEAVHYGRLKIEGMNLSKSMMMKALEQGEISGVADPRLGTLTALRRRGYSPESIRELIWDIGPKPVDVTISWDNLNAMNRKIIDPVAHRYHFVADPVRIRIKGIEEPFEVVLPLHPEHRELGTRVIRIESRDGQVSIYLARSDMPLLNSKGELRLMNLFNFKTVSNHAGEIVGQPIFGKPKDRTRSSIVQWVPSDNNIPVRIVMPDATQVAGLAEANLQREDVNSIVQLVRFGFGRIDEASPELITIYFAHQ